MTREEAIEELKYIEDGLVSCELSYEALDMAIRSIEAWDKVKDDLGCIDRLYLNMGAKEVRVYPKWNVDKIIETHLKGVEE